MRYSIETVWNLLGKEALETTNYSKGSKSSENQVDVDGFKVYTRSLRYMTFYQKGCKCVVCGKEGTHFTLDESAGEDADRRHFNLRADDGTLMTRDHIIPKSRGGREHISNMQTMCVVCNKAKGNHMEGDVPPVKNIISVRTDNATKVDEYIDENDAIFRLLVSAQVTQAPTKKNTVGSKLKKTIEVTRTFLTCLNSGMPYHGRYWYTRDKWEELNNVSL